MKRSSPTRQRLAGLGLVGVPLLTYPILGLVGGEFGGLPSHFIYLFGVWGALILLAAIISEGPGQ